MGIDQLKLALRALQIPTSAYLIGDGCGNEQYAIAEMPNGIWTTFYWEKGQKSSLKEFPTEDAACLDFLKTLKRDVGSYAANN